MRISIYPNIYSNRLLEFLKPSFPVWDVSFLHIAIVKTCSVDCSSTILIDNIFNMLYQAQPPAVARNGNDDKWRLEKTSEASVLGKQFAQAIAMVANGNTDVLLHKKKEYPPCKKIFWEELRYNPSLANKNNNYAYDAYELEQTKYWSKAGKKFVGGLRIPLPRNLTGPLLAEEYPHCFERPVSVFERTRDVRPFSRARKYNKPKDRSVTNPQKVNKMLFVVCYTC